MSVRVGVYNSKLGALAYAAQEVGCNVIWQTESDNEYRRVLTTNFATSTIFDGRPPGTAVDAIIGHAPTIPLPAGRSSDFVVQTTFRFLRVIERIRPPRFIQECAASLLWANEGRYFRRYAAEVAQCGYRFGWRVLDVSHAGEANNPSSRRLYFAASKTETEAAQIFDQFDAGTETIAVPGKVRIRLATIEDQRALVASGQKGLAVHRIATQDELRRGQDSTLTPAQLEQAHGLPVGWTRVHLDATRHRLLKSNHVSIVSATWVIKQVVALSDKSYILGSA